MNIAPLSMVAASAALLSACAYTPDGPSVQVLPGKGKTFEAFQADQARCTVASARSVKGAADRANNFGLGSAAVGTVLGAGLGAAIGGGGGAAIGAAGGAVGGTAIGGGSAGGTQYGIQRQYDNTYEACMIAQGNVLPQITYVQPQPYIVQPAPVYVQPYGYGDYGYGFGSGIGFGSGYYGY